MSEIDRCGHKAQRPSRLWTTASGLALGTALLAACPAAAQSCTGTDTVTCTAGTYASGISYAPTSGMTLNLDDPGIVVQGPVTVSATSANTGDIVVNATHFGSVTSSTGSGILAGNQGPAGNVSATMGGGSVTTTGTSRHGLLAVLFNGTAAGSASATLNGGSVTTSGAAAFGVYAEVGPTSPGGNAVATMTGGSIQTSGMGGNGLVAQLLGAAPPGNASVTMSGGSISVTGNARGILSLTTGSGMALVRMSGGTVQSSLSDGIYADISTVGVGTGVYDVGVSGGTVTGGGGTGAAIHLAATNGGTLAIGSGATIAAGASGVAINQTTGGIVNFTTGGTITGAVNLSAAANTLTATGGSITGDVAGGGLTTLTIDTAAGDSFTYGAGHTMSGLASVTMAGGAAEIDGTVNSGGVTVSGGELHVDGTLGASGGAVQVQTGGVLGGSGTIAGGVDVADGVLAPGNSPGTLTITGDLTLASASRLSMQFGQADVAGGPLNDLVKVNGNLALNGTLDVAASPGGSFDPGLYRIVSYDGALTGAGLTLGAVPAGSQLAVQTSIAGQVNLVNSTGVPVNFWDGAGAAGDDVVQGGAGVWTAAGSNWTLPSGALNAAYDTSALAVFAAAPGAVTVSGPVSAAGMQFSVDGYHLSGDEISLTGGAASTIRVGDGSPAGAGYVATIDDVLSGATTLTKTDLGTLVLTAAETYTGGTAIAGGVLQLGDGGTSGAIAGDVADAGTLAFDRSDAVAFSGAISGTGAVSQIGAGTTTLTGANTYSGGTTLSGGVLKGSAASFGSGAIRDDAALVIDQPSDASFANPIDGTGRFTKTGAGQLTLTGTGGLTGPTTVAAGALAVNGSLAASAFTVLSGATLKGTETVGATTVQAGATIAPGNSIGVLHVNGGFVQQAGSTYQVEIDPASANASDQIVATGAATLAPGADLSVVKTTAGRYRPGAVYTVLSAAGGVSGTYTLGGDVLPVSAFLALKDSYDAGHAYVTVVQTADPASVATTPNEGAVAAALPSSGELSDAVLNSPTPDAARQAFDQLAGDGHAAARGALVTDSRLVRDLAIGRVQALFCSPAGLVADKADGACPQDGRPAAWGQAFDAWGRTDGDGNAGEASRSTGGFLIGADTPLGGPWRGGGFAGYSHTRLDMDGASASAEVDSYHLGVYGGAQYGALGLRLGGGYAFHHIATDRTVSLPELSQHLEAGYDAGTAQGFAQAGYRLEVGRASMEPFVEAAYVAVRSDGFTEHGGIAALAGGADQTGAAFSTLGVKPAVPLVFGQVRASVHGLFGWRHDYGDVTPASTMRFAAGGAAFEVEGARLARDAGVAEVGLDMKNDNATFALTYGAQGWTHDFDQTVRAEFRLVF